MRVASRRRWWWWERRGRKKKDIDRRSSSLQGLCSCFLSRTSCFLDCDFSRFFYERACTRVDAREGRANHEPSARPSALGKAVAVATETREDGKTGGTSMIHESRLLGGYFNEQIDHARTHSNKCLLTEKTTATIRPLVSGLSIVRSSVTICNGYLSRRPAAAAVHTVVRAAKIPRYTWATALPPVSRRSPRAWCSLTNFGIDSVFEVFEARRVDHRNLKSCDVSNRSSNQISQCKSKAEADAW